MNKRYAVFAVVLIVTMVLAACQPQTIVVEKEVEKVVTQVVKETVKETVVVQGTPQVVEKEVTKVVEKVTTPTPAPVDRTGAWLDMAVFIEGKRSGGF